MFKKKNIVKVKSFKIEFNHNAKTVVKALNLSDEELAESLTSMSFALLASTKISEVIEFLCRNLRGKELLWAIYKLGTITGEGGEKEKIPENMFR